jgi:transposase InsO family protein
VKELSLQYTITDLCSALQVSRSGYYQWNSDGVGPRRSANMDLVQKIENIFKEHDENYGSPRITAELRQRGTKCNRKRVERLMRLEGMKACQKKRFRMMTTDSDHDYPIAPNRLPDKKITGANQGWCTDITSVRRDRRRLALSGWCPGSLQPQDRRLGYGRPFGDKSALGCAKHG